MNSFVVDASVAIKWLIQEPGSAEALALRGNTLLAPDLLVAECTNILWKKVQRGELSQDEAMFAARLLARAEIDLVPMRPLLEPAARLAIRLRHPAYDCFYMALAEERACPFVTADLALQRKAIAAGLGERVQPLIAPT